MAAGFFGPLNLESFVFLPERLKDLKHKTRLNRQ